MTCAAFPGPTQTRMNGYRGKRRNCTQKLYWNLRNGPNCSGPRNGQRKEHAGHHPNRARSNREHDRVQQVRPVAVIAAALKTQGLTLGQQLRKNFGAISAEDGSLYWPRALAAASQTANAIRIPRAYQRYAPERIPDANFLQSAFNVSASG